MIARVMASSHVYRLGVAARAAKPNAYGVILTRRTGRHVGPRSAGFHGGHDTEATTLDAPTGGP